MAICSKEIIVTRADKEAGTPTTKSRWLQRMEVVINALGLNGDIDDGATEKAWLAKVEPKAYPNRRFGRHLVRHWQAAPASSRQLKLIFGLLTLRNICKKILKLKPLDDIDRSADAALRGILFHDALADFSKANATVNWEQTHCNNCLILAKSILQARLASHQSAISGGQDLRRWLHGLSKMNIAAVMICNQFMLKLVGIFLKAAQGPIKLTARADRLEYDNDGQWTIVDYKTGTVPSGSLIKKGLRNQLAVEGLIAFDGGFESLPAGAIRSLEYWQLSGKKSARVKSKRRLPIYLMSMKSGSVSRDWLIILIRPTPYPAS